VQEQPPRSDSITERYPYQDPTGQQFDVFLSHAGQQKVNVAGILKEKLEQGYPALRGRVFLDDISLPRGDIARECIYKSLRDSFVGEALCVSCNNLHRGRDCDACLYPMCA
jgi:hypothetical protein